MPASGTAPALAPCLYAGTLAPALSGVTPTGAT